MKQLQIACVPANWDESTITAVGLTRNGRAALPVTTVTKDLPEPWLTVWHGLVDTLKGVAPGEWAATYIEARLAYEQPETTEQDAVEDEPTPIVSLTVHRRWDDQTTAEPVMLQMRDASAVAFFEYLTTEE